MECYAFLGIQGSGKGTQAERLSVHLEYQHINIGDLFRSHIKSKSRIGEKVHQIIRRGELVPDDLVFDLVDQSINSRVKGIVFDGFPRTVAQAEHLIREYKLKQVFYLELEEDEAIKRISSRRVCLHCQTNYNLISQPPINAGICDICSGELDLRQDDQPEAIHKRFAEFTRQTLPLKSYFEKRNLLYIISAGESIEKVFEQILAKLVKC